MQLILILAQPMVSNGNHLIFEPVAVGRNQGGKNDDLTGLFWTSRLHILYAVTARCFCGMSRLISGKTHLKAEIFLK